MGSASPHSEASSQEQGPGLQPPAVWPPGSTGCLPPPSQELSLPEDTAKGDHTRSTTGWVRWQWVVSLRTILLHPIYISSCSCSLPFSLPWPLMLPKHLRDAMQAGPRCPLRESVSRENAAIGAHGASSTTRCPGVGHSSPLYLAICTSHLILSTGEFGSSFTQA